MEVLSPAAALGYPLLGEAARLDLVQNSLHLGSHSIVHHSRPSCQISVFGGVGDGIAHSCDALLIHEIHDQLQLVKTFKVGDLRLIARVGEDFKGGFHQRGQPAAEHYLLAEKVGFALFGEGGLQDAAPSAAYGRSIGQHERLGAAGGVLGDGDQARHAAAFGEDSAHQMAGPFGGDHHHIYVVGRDDAVKADVEAVGEQQRIASRQVRGHMLLVDVALLGVGQQHHHRVCFGRCLAQRQHGEAFLLGFGDRRRAVSQPHHHIHP